MFHSRNLRALFLLALLPLAACGSCLDPFNKLSDCPKWGATMQHSVRWLVTLVMLFALLVVCMPHPAYADTVKLTPVYDLVNQVLQELLEGLAMAVSGWLMFIFHKYLTPYIGAQMEAKARDSLNTALANGVQIALQKVDGAEKVHTDIEVKGMVAAWAAQYAVDHAPGAVGKFGLDPNQLALKALAYIPTPPTTVGLTATAEGSTAHVDVQPLPPATK